MRSYSMDDLQIGMTLAKEVNILDGLIVIKAGIEIDESMIEIFKKYQIETVDIKVHTDQGIVYSEDEIQQMKSDISEKKKVLFKDCLNDEYMRELYRVVCDLRLAESMNGQE